MKTKNKKPTPRERDILAAIRLHRKEHKHSPTFAEIGRKIGIGKETVGFHLRNMKEKGLVTWIERSPRTLQIL